MIEHWGLRGELRRLPGERDENYLVDGRHVLKISRDSRALLEAQTRVLDRLASTGLTQEVVATLRGERLVECEDGRLARVLTYLPGQPFADVPTASLRSVGAALARIDAALDGYDEPAFRRDFYWDLERAPTVVTEPRMLAVYAAEVAPRLDGLRRGLIHGDANEHNLLVGPDERVTGVLDFGDMVWSRVVYDPAIAAAYAMRMAGDPLDVVIEVIAAYHERFPLSEDELAVVYPLACLRLCHSAAVAAIQQARDPSNAYLGVSQEWIRRVLPVALAVDPAAARERLHAACGKADTLHRRRVLIAPSLSLSYADPLKIVRGEGAYLFDEAGRRYLDCVNNVAHVGHGNPRVLAALAEQAAVLNTNTRYLHDTLVDYAQALVERLPEPLCVCLFMCSGSEANDLALRIARTVTGRREVIVLEGAYHGNTQAGIDVSPYKYRGRGGAGRPDWVREAPMPDPYRGRFRGPDSGPAYAREVERLVASPAAFICEPLMSCAGQIEPPPGFLPSAFAAVRTVGGLCIADEVQVGFGRVGDAFWGFETQGVVPDIVTLGKPIGNGHPMAAVITTREIADAFANGMEYMSTFGGNPVSCAVGLAVLRELDERALQENARIVGAHLLAGLRAIESPFVGDARGRGLFVGVELMRDGAPAPDVADRVVNRLRSEGVLISADGPDGNVIKIKPPLVFSRENADELVERLRAALE